VFYNLVFIVLGHYIQQPMTISIWPTVFRGKFCQILQAS